MDEQTPDGPIGTPPWGAPPAGPGPGTPLPPGAPGPTGPIVNWAPAPTAAEVPGAPGLSDVPVESKESGRRGRVSPLVMGPAGHKMTVQPRADRFAGSMKGTG